VNSEGRNNGKQKQRDQKKEKKTK